MKPRYAIVRVDEGCPIGNDFFKNQTVKNICKASKNCSNCALGDTKEQLIRKVAQALIIDRIERCRRAPNCDVNQTILEHVSRICLEKAHFIVEFLGVEE